MITGFNSDVDRDGRIFHVQTEDKGFGNPVVESLIYCGGEIVDSRETSYRELTESGEFSEAELLSRMEAQHQGMIREIHNGKYDDEAPKPFGHAIITNRSLDEVVLEFLQQNMRLESIRLELIDRQILQEGTRPTLRMKVLEESSSRPVGGARVLVSLISTEGEPQELYSASTDRDGFVEACFDIPMLPSADLALICSAEAAGQSAEIRQSVAKAKLGSSG
jgi:hypothetical protein